MKSGKCGLSQVDSWPGFLVVLLMHTTLWPVTAAETATPKTKFKAAVYGHKVILPPQRNVSREEALRYMKSNLDVYRIQAAEAKTQGADILVFPEDGLYGYSFTRESVYNYLEVIPTPLDPEWSPCNDPDRHPNTEVLYELSCIAKNNSLYIVANMGDKQPCDIDLDPKCPKDGRYQFNTDVAFDPNGTILAKYHKYHLFYEEQFDTPELQIVTFDTPFGRFGMMVCFDVLFLKPGLPLILENQISNIVFPTAWMDALPLLSALGFHSSFARALGVNFLSANNHLPENRMHGSGIYSPYGMKSFYYGATADTKPALLVAELDILDKPRPNIDIAVNGFDSDLFEKNCDVDKTFASEALHQDEFHSELFYDNFTFTALETRTGSLKVCQKEVCCSLDYSISNDSFNNELFALGAFDGLHTYEGRYYFQICALVKCAQGGNRKSCGSVTDISTIHFAYLKLDSYMTTPFIYPQMLLSGGGGEILLAEADAWGFRNDRLWTNVPPRQPVLSAALFGRHYLRDNCIDSGSSLSTSIIQMALLTVSGIITTRFLQQERDM